MAEEIKTTPAPEGQTLEPPAPEVSEAPPAPEPGAQGVIPGIMALLGEWKEKQPPELGKGEKKTDREK